MVVDVADELFHQLEAIASRKGTSVEALLRDHVVQEWIGKRRIVNEKIFGETSGSVQEDTSRRIA